MNVIRIDSVTHRAMARTQGSFRFPGILLIVYLLVSTQTAFADESAPTQNTGPLNIDAAMQALRISKLAAENAMQELSLRAFRKALAGGPPRQATAPPSVASTAVSRSRSRTTATIFNRNNSFSPVIVQQPVPSQRTKTSTKRRLQDWEAVALVEESQRELDVLWQQKDFSPDEVYQALADVVFPKARTDSVFLYAAAAGKDVNTLHSGRSIGARLIEWAERAGQLDDLFRRAGERAGSRSQPFSAAVYQAEISLYMKNPESIEQNLVSLLKFAGNAFPTTYNEQVLSVSLRAMAQGASLQNALPVFDVATNQIVSATNAARSVKMGSSQVEPASTLLLTSARIRLNSGEREKGLERLETYLNLNNSKNQRYSGKYGSQLRQHQLYTAAGVLLATDNAELAIEKLEQAAGLTASPSSGQTTDTTQRLIRYLRQQPVEERYQLLRRLCLPAKDGKTVTLLSVFRPSVVPPELFLPAGGASTSAVSMSKTSPRGHERLAGTGLMLVDAAEELGRLQELRLEFESLQKKEVANAGAVLVLILCRLGQAAEATLLVEDQIELVGYDIRTKQKTRDPFTDVMVCMEALRHEETRNAGRKLADEILRYVPTARTPHAFEAISELKLTSLAGRKAGSAIPRPAMWVPSSTTSVSALDDGAALPLWTADGGEIAHRSGSGWDSLYLKFPLTGTFDFVVENSADTQQEASIGYGGVLLTTRNSNDSMHVQAIGGHGIENTWKAYSRENEPNETRLLVRDNKAGFTVNNRPCFRDNTEATGSPWIFLCCKSDQQGAFHFPRITGNPIIPSKLALSADPMMRGWTTAALGETRSPALLSSRTDPKSVPVNPHWKWIDGRIIGKRESSQAGDSQSLTEYVTEVLLTKCSGNLLQYDRPLQTGDTVSWEFEYSEDKKNVSPAIGRIAFLLESDELRLRHLVSDGNWYGISATNSIPVPERHESGLPLKTGWNSATISIQAAPGPETDSVSQRNSEHHDATTFGYDSGTNSGILVLTLNGETIYRSAVPQTGTRQFGFYHDSQIHEATVRNVTLTGNWPKELPVEYRSDLAKAITLPKSEQIVWRDGSAGSQSSGCHPLTVMRHAQALSPEERYKFLKAWILPGEHRRNFRINGAAKVRTPLEHTASVELSPLANGEPSLVSPALQLVDLADELNCLPELADILSTVDTNTNEDTQACHGFLALVAMKSGDVPRAKDHLHQMTSLLQLSQLAGFIDRSEQTSAGRWMDLIVASRALKEPELWADAQTILAFASSGDSTVSRYSQALFHRFEQLINGRQPAKEQPPSGWHAVEHTSSQMHGRGLPSSQWLLSDDGVIRHGPGHDNDHLLFSVPIRGKFVFECELTPLGEDAVQLGYNGLALGFSDNPKEVFTIPFGRKPRRHRQSANLKLDEWVKCRIVFLDNKLRFQVNEQTVYQTTLTRLPDPWIFFRCKGSGKGAIRNIRLSGDYSIPDTFKPDTSVYLHGWSPHYYNESVGSGNPWAGKSDVILATSHESSGINVESILQYHRPMQEDGKIRYEFFYEPGKTLLHPALGRLAFLLDETQGVLLHQLTDERYDYTGLMADNQLREPQHQLTEKLPLQAGAWNAMTIALKGDEVTLKLNEVDVYRRTLPAHNTRIPGLFHYKDQTGGQVRNITWSGSWPQKVPESVAAD